MIMNILKNMRQAITIKQYQKGFTLIEVLISMLVLSIGLLGLAALQIASVKANHSAQYRTEATLATYDLIDRMRVNREAANTNGYDIVVGQTPPTGSLSGTDLTAWKAALASALPSGDGEVMTTVTGVGAAATTVVEVTVQWDDSRGDAGTSVYQKFILSVQL